MIGAMRDLRGVVFTVDVSRIEASWQRVARTMSRLADLKQRHEGAVPVEE